MMGWEHVDGRAWLLLFAQETNNAVLKGKLKLHPLRLRDPIVSLERQFFSIFPFLDGQRKGFRYRAHGGL
jgi:hypothetical protein